MMKQSFFVILSAFMDMGSFCDATSHVTSPFPITTSRQNNRLVSIRGGSASPLQGRSPAKVVRRSPWSSIAHNRQPTNDQLVLHQPQQRNELQDGKEQMEAFLTRDSRNTFIGRVYAILAGQLLVTALSIVLFGTYDLGTKWINRPGSMAAVVPGVSLLISTVAWFIMCASATARRASPLKWQLLAIFTLGEAVSVGFLSSFFKFETVLIAMATTALATGAVSAYTILNRNSGRDLSQWGSSLTSAGLIFLCLSLVQLFEILGVLPKGFLPLNDLLLSGFGATLFSFYLAHHTRMIVGGKHTKYQMTEKDYVFGAMTLYNDIINIFIYILKILGSDRE